MFSYSGFTLTGGGDPVSVNARTVTANFFDVLGARPLIGTSFKPGDDGPGAERLAVLGHRLWSDRSAATRASLGRIILDTSVPQIGVMPVRGDMDPIFGSVTCRRAGGSASMGMHGRLRRDASISTASRIEPSPSNLQRQYPTRTPGGVSVAHALPGPGHGARRPFTSPGAVLFTSC